jgi:predicted lipoprotein with Yx(FWY)xxD motif
MMRIRSLAVTGVAIGGLLLAGCGSSSSKTSAGTSPSTAAPTSAAPATSSTSTSVGAVGGARSALAAVGPAAPSSNTVSLAKGAAGIFVIAPNGHSLYVFAKDQGTTSGCTGACASTWPALTASGPVTVGASVNQAEVGTANGQVPNQVTYYGHLLYMFAGDSAPGQTNGASIPNWHLLGPVGNVMLAHS